MSRPASVAVLVGLFALPLAVEAGRMAISGRAQTWELVVIASLRNMGPGLAALARIPSFARTAALVSLILVVTASSSADGDASLVAIAASYAVAGSLWLAASHWRALFRPGTAPGTRRFPALSLACAMGIVGAAIAIAAIGPMRAATVLAGLVSS